MRRVLAIVAAPLVCVAIFALVERSRLHHQSTGEFRADRILVEKSTRKLTLFRNDVALKSYHVALGGAPLGPKEREGDQRTPEGDYVIDFHKPDSDYHLALHISYPNVSDAAAAAQHGVDPGGDIMIHGLPNGHEQMPDWHPGPDWTAGCIAVTDEEIEEIYRAVADGTRVEIRK